MEKKKKNYINDISVFLHCNLVSTAYNVSAATTIITTLPSISMPSSVTVDKSITVSWNSISGATGYSIALLDQTTGSKVTSSITKTNYKANANTLTAGHSYKLWVGVTNAVGTNVGGAVFFIVNRPVQSASVMDSSSLVYCICVKFSSLISIGNWLWNKYKLDV